MQEIWVYRLGTKSCASIALWKLIEISSLTSPGVLVLNIIWAALCVDLLCLTYFIQRKYKQFLFQILLNILCAEQRHSVSSLFLNLLFFNTAPFEIAGNMGSGCISKKLLLFPVASYYFSLYRQYFLHNFQNSVSTLRQNKIILLT